jgi:hypothetical protein
MALGSKRSSLLEEMVGWELAAFLGLLTYLCTIAFEHGVALYWGFPPEIITFTLENAFNAFLPAIACGVVVVIVLEALKDPPASKALRIWLGGSGLVLLGFAIYGIIHLAKAESDKGRALLGACFFMMILALGALFAPDERTPKVPRPLLAYLLMICTLPWCAFGVGYVFQSDRTRFMVIEVDHERLVVLRTYGAMCVCHDLPATPLLTDRFRVVSVGDSAGVAVHQETLKLTPVSLQTRPSATEKLH